jgi:AsmA protein
MTFARVLRLSLITIASLLAALVVAALLSLYLLLQPDRFTNMLQQQANAAGLELTLSSPASPTLFPHPALELEGITLTARGASMPILLAASGRMALPWRTLFGGSKVISRLQINDPRVDLDALQAWVSSLPPTPADEPLQVPRIATGIHIRGGSVVHGDNQLLSDASLDAGKLEPDQVFRIDMSANEPGGTPMRVQLSAVPHADAGALQLKDIALRVSDDNAAVLDLSGTARWHGAADATVTLDGMLKQSGDGVYSTSVSLMPSSGNAPMLLQLKLSGSDKNVNLQLPPLALIQWWNQLNDTQTPRLAVPPGKGQVNLAKFDLGSVHIEGLSVQSSGSAPISASSAAPATAASATNASQ